MPIISDCGEKWGLIVHQSNSHVLKATVAFPLDTHYYI